MEPFRIKSTTSTGAFDNPRNSFYDLSFDPRPQGQVSPYGYAQQGDVEFEDYAQGTYIDGWEGGNDSEFLSGLWNFGGTLALTAAAAFTPLPSSTAKAFPTVGHTSEFGLTNIASGIRNMFSGGGSGWRKGANRPHWVTEDFPGMTPIPRTLANHNVPRDIATPRNQYEAAQVLRQDQIAQRNRAEIALNGTRRPNDRAGRPNIDAIDDWAASQSANIPNPNWTMFFGESMKSQDKARNIFEARTLANSLETGTPFRALQERADMTRYLADADPAFAREFATQADTSLIGLALGRRVDNPVVPYPQRYADAFEGASTRSIDFAGRAEQLKHLAKTGRMGGRHASQTDAVTEASFRFGDYARTAAGFFGAFHGGNYLYQRSQFDRGNAERALMRQVHPDQEHNESFYYHFQDNNFPPRSGQAQWMIGDYVALGQSRDRTEVYQNAPDEIKSKFDRALQEFHPERVDAYAEVGLRTLQTKQNYWDEDPQVLEEGKVHPIYARTEARNRTDAWNMQDRLLYLMSDQNPDFQTRRDAYIGMHGQEAYDGKAQSVQQFLTGVENIAQHHPATYLVNMGATEGVSADDWAEFLWEN